MLYANEEGLVRGLGVELAFSVQSGDGIAVVVGLWVDEET